MLRERAYMLGKEPCEANTGLHVFAFGSRDHSLCHCGKHQLGFYESRYVEVPINEILVDTNPIAIQAALVRLDTAIGTLDSLRQAGYMVVFDKAGARVLQQATVMAHGEGTSVDCLRQLARQLK